MEPFVAFVAGYFDNHIINALIKRSFHDLGEKFEGTSDSVMLMPFYPHAPL